MGGDFRPPAIPLVTVDPYFSVWSMADNLYDDFTRHWTGRNNGMTGIIRIDGVPYIFMGSLFRSDVPKDMLLDTMNQTSVKVNALNTIYSFERGGVGLTVTFTTPLLMDNLDILSRPVSYIICDVTSLDGKNHDVSIYIDVTAEWCVNEPKQYVVCGEKVIEDKLSGAWFGNLAQDVLNKCGDDIRIDWGYFYLMAPDNNNTIIRINNHKIRKKFAIDGIVESDDEYLYPRQVMNSMPVISYVHQYGVVGCNGKSTYIMLAYDDVFSVEYFNKKLPAYWRRHGLDFENMLCSAAEEYESLMINTELFDNQLNEMAEQIGGSEYAQMCSLAYRQAISAHKLVADEKDEVLFLSKENFSNGCMGTVDVSYPSTSLFLLYNPELVKGMLRPVFRFAVSDNWPYTFAPHDVGRYPLANGQAYGKPDNEYLLERQMPVEECGNMLIMTTAVCIREEDASFALKNFDILKQWADYLVENGMDPGDQLCTDDFAGHLAHNANLSIKAILGIACFSVLCKMLDKNDSYNSYNSTAIDMAKQWESMANDGDHYKLTFDKYNTWSQKYNLVWDELLGINIFSKEIKKKEIAWYLNMQNEYGIPLDCRNNDTKVDWQLWSASLSDSDEEFKKLIKPIWDFLSETPCRAPFTDRYDTDMGLQTNCRCHTGGWGYRGRSVVGGIFIRILQNKWI